VCFRGFFDGGLVGFVDELPQPVGFDLSTVASSGRKLRDESCGGNALVSMARVILLPLMGGTIDGSKFLAEGFVVTLVFVGGSGIHKWIRHPRVAGAGSVNHNEFYGRHQQPCLRFEGHRVSFSISLVILSQFAGCKLSSWAVNDLEQFTNHGKLHPLVPFLGLILWVAGFHKWWNG
jgi:hypothetical protein